MKKFLKIIAYLLIIVCVCGAVSLSHANDDSSPENPSCIGRIFSFLWGIIYYPIYFLWLCIYYIFYSLYYAVYYLIKALWFCIYWIVIGIYYAGYYLINAVWFCIYWIAIAVWYLISGIWYGFKWLLGKVYWILENVISWGKNIKDWFEDLIFSTFGAVFGTVILVIISIFISKYITFPATNYAKDTYESSGAKEFVDKAVDEVKDKL